MNANMPPGHGLRRQHDSITSSASGQALRHSHAIQLAKPSAAVAATADDELQLHKHLMQLDEKKMHPLLQAVIATTAEVNHTTAYADKVKEDLAVKKTSITNITASIANLQRQLEAQANEKAAANKQRAEALSALQAAKMDEKNAKVDKSEAERAYHEAYTFSGSGDAEAARQRRVAAWGALRTAREKLDDKQDDYHDAQSDSNDAHSKFESVSAQLDDDQDRREKLVSKLGPLQAKLETAQARLPEAESKLSTATTQYSAQQNKMKADQSKVSKLTRIYHITKEVAFKDSMQMRSARDAGRAEHLVSAHSAKRHSFGREQSAAPASMGEATLDPARL